MSKSWTQEASAVNGIGVANGQHYAAIPLLMVMPGRIAKHLLKDTPEERPFTHKL